MITYILRALDINGSESFYTGRAGDGWVSVDITNAFTYESLDGARNQGKRFNRNERLHGLWFIAVRSDYRTYDGVEAMNAGLLEA